jgi:hypothetical protein
MSDRRKAQILDMAMHSWRNVLRLPLSHHDRLRNANVILHGAYEEYIQLDEVRNAPTATPTERSEV